MKINPALQYVKEVKETSDLQEISQLLSTGEWIAICATATEPHIFSLGRITTPSAPETGADGTAPADAKRVKTYGTSKRTVVRGYDTSAIASEVCDVLAKHDLPLSILEHVVLQIWNCAEERCVISNHVGTAAAHPDKPGFSIEQFLEDFTDNTCGLFDLKQGKIMTFLIQGIAAALAEQFQNDTPMVINLSFDPAGFDAK